jgi:hypothetical protein
MNLKETNQALALAQAFDRRTVGEMDVRAWHSVLGDLDAADVMEAVRHHYASETDWIMPGHVRRIAMQLVEARARAALSTGWAPGQYGVPKADAMPEIAGPVAEGELTPEVRNLLASVRAMLPVGSREALMPRTVAWEQEHAAYERHLHAVPNPHYRPDAVAGRQECRENGPHDDGMHIETCPDAVG